MTKPSNITEIEKKVEKLEFTQKEYRENQDNMMITQGEILRNQTEFGAQLKTIHDALLGNELTKDLEEGLIKKVGRLCDNMNQIQKWREKMTTINGILYTISTGIIGFLSAIIIKNWDKIFG